MYITICILFIYTVLYLYVTALQNFHHVLTVLMNTDIGVHFQLSCYVAKSLYYPEKPVVVLNSKASFDIKIKLLEKDHTAISKS